MHHRGGGVSYPFGGGRQYFRADAKPNFGGALIPLSRLHSRSGNATVRVLLAVLGDVHRFEHSRSVAAFIARAAHCA
ncbi:protein of unknown function [Methylocaldum szegediense]|uniref:Uncharacterized protein n=1 Tax=Methylocaldum szegediense TaxID=73780 RepID=A0ABM9I305_9GAMM|nr:protein of unknown function [Methylocaldum szegediense]